VAPAREESSLQGDHCDGKIWVESNPAEPAKPKGKKDRPAKKIHEARHMQKKSHFYLFGGGARAAEPVKMKKRKRENAGGKH